MQHKGILEHAIQALNIKSKNPPRLQTLEVSLGSQPEKAC
jgi:hypothetical protein